MKWRGKGGKEREGGRGKRRGEEEEKRRRGEEEKRSSFKPDSSIEEGITSFPVRRKCKMGAK